MKNKNINFCNEFFPENEGYIYKNNNDKLLIVSECNHCVFKKSTKCKDNISKKSLNKFNNFKNDFL